MKEFLTELWGYEPHGIRPFIAFSIIWLINGYAPRGWLYRDGIIRWEDFCYNYTYHYNTVPPLGETIVEACRYIRSSL